MIKSSCLRTLVYDPLLGQKITIFDDFRPFFDIFGFELVPAGASLCDSSCVSSSSGTDTTVVNDELLRVSSASINAAIMDKLTEYETALRNSQKQKDKIAANLISQAMAVLKMKKSVK